jgi:hypothetical protein
MKRVLILIAALALSAAAFARIDPTRPMLTGRGNIDARPQRAIVANQVAGELGDDVVVLDKLVVTGSLIRPKKHPVSFARR